MQKVQRELVLQDVAGSQCRNLLNGFKIEIFRQIRVLAHTSKIGPSKSCDRSIVLALDAVTDKNTVIAETAVGKVVVTPSKNMQK